MISRFRPLLLVGLVGLAGCAEGDNLLGDARAAHSGEYDRRLAAQQQQIDAERSRTAALNAQAGSLKASNTALDVAIKRQRRDVAALRARVDKLDKNIGSLRVATADAEAKRADLERQVAGV